MSELAPSLEGRVWLVRNPLRRGGPPEERLTLTFGLGLRRTGGGTGSWRAIANALDAAWRAR
jgi:hypothetical protein